MATMSSRAPTYVKAAERNGSAHERDARPIAKPDRLQPNDVIPIMKSSSLRHDDVTSILKPDGARHNDKNGTYVQKTTVLDCTKMWQLIMFPLAL